MRNKKVLSLLMVLTLLLSGLTVGSFAAEEKVVTILQTSDLHGRIYAHDYATDSGDSDAGLAKIYTHVKAERALDPDLLLIDTGDTVQDNSAELFNMQDVHPMVEAMNYMGYDAWTIGNHEFNFELDFLKKNIDAFEGTVLSANTYNEGTETRWQAPYEIYDVDGVRVAIVGLLPPHIPLWEASSPSHFEGLEFRGTLEEAEKVVKELDGKYDVLIGAFHLGVDGDHGYIGAGEIAENIPAFDAIFTGHAHAKINEEINGVKIIEPGKYGWSLAKATIKVEKSATGYDVLSVDTVQLETKTLEEAPEILEKFAYVHETSIEDANTVVGTISNDFIERPDYITGEDTISTMPTSQIVDTAIIDLINEVQMHYTKSDVSSAALFNFGSNLKAGDFKKKDVAFIYKYPNTLMGVNITGENLVKYMEWSATYYNTVEAGDVTISFNPEIRGYNYDMFTGVDYKIDVSKEAGSRIVDAMIDGKMIEMDKTYKLAVNNYRFGTLINLGLVTNEDQYYSSYEEMQDAGRIRDLIIKYTQEVKKGALNPMIDNNWEIVGFDLDQKLTEKVFPLVASGEIVIPTSEDGRTKNVEALNIFDLAKNGKVQMKTYIVKSGDLLWKIAKAHGITWEEAAALNGVTNPNMIMPGQTLVMP